MRTRVRLCAWLCFAMLFIPVFHEPTYAAENAPSCTSEATKWLSSIRNGPEYFDDFIGPLSNALTRCSITLEVIGTSKAELDRLRIEGCRIEASVWLRRLRSGTRMYDSYTRYVRSAADRCGLTLRDVGTSETELRTLRRKNASGVLN